MKHLAVPFGIACLLAASLTASAGGLHFEGCSHFQPADLERGLTWNLEYQLARVSGGGSDMREVLPRLLTAGYRRAGFPEAEISASPESNGTVAVRIREGPRYLCGELRIRGLKDTPEDKLRALLLASSDDPAATGQALGWAPTNGAPFDPGRLEAFRTCVSNALTELGRFGAEFDLALRPEPGSGRATLALDVRSEGLERVVGTLRVEGAVTNRTDDILARLGLRPGTRLTRTLTEEATERLLRTGRFISVELVPGAAEADGRTPVTVRVLEAPGVMPLHQELPPASAPLLRVQDWLQAFRTNGDELVFTVEKGPADGVAALALHVIVAPARGVLAILRKDGGGRPLATFHGAASQEFAFFLPDPPRRYTAPAQDMGMTMTFRVEAHPPDKDGAWRSLSLGLGFTSRAGPSGPAELDFDIAPAVLASFASEYGDRARLEDGLCVIEHSNAAIRVEAATGRPRVLLANPSPDVRCVVRVETGAMDRVLEPLRAEAAGWTNRYDPAHPLASAAACLVPELARIPMLSTGVLARVTPEQGARIADAMHRIGGAIASAGWTNAPAWTAATTNAMVIPPDASRVPSQVTLSMPGMVAVVMLALESSLVDSSSWVAGLLRAYAFKTIGRGDLLDREFQRAMTSREPGPLALLCWARLAAGASPEMGRRVASRGLEDLSTEAFRRDVRSLVAPQTPAGEIVLRSGEILATLTPEEADALALLFPPERSGAFRRLLASLRGRTGVAPMERVLGAADAAWEAGLRDDLARQLKAIGEGAATP